MDDNQPDDLPEPDDLYEALDAWSNYMFDVAQYSHSTIDGKLWVATTFTHWLADQDLISTRELTADVVSAFTVAKYGHLADKTFNLYLSHLRIYIAFLRKKRLLGEDQNPETDLISRRRPESARTKTFIYPEDIADLAEKAAVWHDRDKYFLLFAYYGARRAGEVCALRWADIDTTSRPGYKYGLFRFKNNKIGGDSKKRPIDPLLLPYIIEWRTRFQELLNEQFGFKDNGQPRRKIRPEDYVFPPLDVGPGEAIKGVRRPLEIILGHELPYKSIWHSLRKAGVFGLHSARRGGIISLDERFGIEAARIMADHKTQGQTADYMDKDRQAEAVGDMFAKEQEKKLKKKLKRSKKAAKAAGLPSLEERRAGGRRAS